MDGCGVDACELIDPLLYDPDFHNLVLCGNDDIDWFRHK